MPRMASVHVDHNKSFTGEGGSADFEGSRDFSMRASVAKHGFYVASRLLGFLN